MATELEERCPICLECQEDAAYIVPCLHQFCYACILRWAVEEPWCPLCKRTMQSFVRSVRADNYFEEDVLRPSGTTPRAAAAHQVERVPVPPATRSPPRPVTSQPPAVETVPRALVGGLQPDTWASLFDDYPELLQQFQPRLQEQLRLTFREEPSTAVILEDLILCVLGVFGLNEEVLVWLMQSSLQNDASTFVQQLIGVAVQCCSREAYRLLGLTDGHAAEGQEGTSAADPHLAASQGRSPAPGPAPCSSAAAADEEEHPSTSTAALHGGPGNSPDALIPNSGEQDELHEDVREAVAGPSTSSQVRDHSCGEPQRCLKRMADSSPDSSQPPKKPHH